MVARRSLKLPITLGVVMIVLLVALAVGWVLLAVFGALANKESAVLYWTFLSVGSTFFVLVLVGVAFYLALSIKAINLTRRQSNFIDSVTHELKSPIASLKLYLQTLNRRDVNRDQQQKFFRFMLDDIERLDHLINHVLEAGRLGKESSDAETEEVEFADLLTKCAETTRLRYQVPPETVQLDLTPCVLRTHRIDVEMIFNNLIDNAVKYAGAEPCVEIGLRLEDGCKIVVRIGDNGRGIPHRLRRKIFGRFVRLGSELERDKPGTGLGLYIVRTLVRRMGGSVLVSDAEQGTGAVFEVKLPGGRAVADSKPATSDAGVQDPQVA